MSNRVTRAFNRWLKDLSPEEQAKLLKERRDQRRAFPGPGVTIRQPSGREYKVGPDGSYRRTS